MPKGGTDDYTDESVTAFVEQWNNWSTSAQRQSIYRKAWALDHGSALGFITAVATDQGEQVPDHIVHYLTKHAEFSETFLSAFKKVTKHNWRLGAVVDQYNFEFPPAVTSAKNKSEEIVFLYVVGDPTA